jgi:hypothetical protein
MMNMLELIKKLPEPERTLGIELHYKWERDQVELAYKEAYNEGYKLGYEEELTRFISNIIVKMPNASDFEIADMCGLKKSIVKRVRQSLK